ncbi:protein containing DUF1586 [Rhodopirellula baltica SWK14]|uniref:Protein containing DUF1586 n=1 Tax=Rhodopirellula baltica SWK14 TaxID=993516 RepID=L7CL43_RHOBT|nr:protein containing DUF1586 [Rhodopirellula baltica SWK14]
MSRTALAAVDQKPTGANAHRLISLIRDKYKLTARLPSPGGKGDRLTDGTEWISGRMHQSVKR